MYMLNTLISNYLKFVLHVNFNSLYCSCIAAIVYGGHSCHFYGDAVGPQGALEPFRSCPACFGHYGHFLGELDFSITPKHCILRLFFDIVTD